MNESAFFHAALALALGMGAQVVAARLAVPGLIVLLAVGLLAGPEGLGLLDPAALGSGRTELVSLAVTVILFEGGLALRIETLRQQQRSLLLLLTAGSLVSMLVGMLAAHFLLGFGWHVASLYGALMIVTGPTVVTPLLARISVDRTTRELLVSEGVLIDPIGAIVGIVAAEYVLGQAAAWEAGALIFVRLAAGGLVGAAAALLFGGVLRRGWIPRDLRNAVALGVVLATAAFSSRLSAEAGLMAAVVQGVVLGNIGLRELGRLRQFKEELTVLLLSFLFVLLAADLPLSAVRALGWPAFYVVGVLVWVGRPLAVFLCTYGSELNLRQRAFIAWMCPRGIVAAAVSGLFAIWLNRAGLPDGDRLEALVFVTVALTVGVQGLSAGLVARLLRIDLPEPRGILVVGADALGFLVARLLVAHGRPVVLMDRNPERCRAAQEEGLLAFAGDALSAEDLEGAGAQYADTVLALTRNRELNELIAQRIRDNFRVERVLPVTEAPSHVSSERPFPGQFPGVDDANRHLLFGRAALVEYEAVPGDLVGRSLGELPCRRGEFVLLIRRRDRVYVATHAQILAVGDVLLCLRCGTKDSPLAAQMKVLRAAEVPQQS